MFPVGTGITLIPPMSFLYMYLHPEGCILLHCSYGGMHALYTGPLKGQVKAPAMTQGNLVGKYLSFSTPFIVMILSSPAAPIRLSPLAQIDN